MRSFFAFACFVIVATNHAFSADFTIIGQGKARLVGSLIDGDIERLIRAQRDSIRAFGGPLRTLELNSAGGSITEAVRLARLVELFRLDTRVVNGGFCASSCFILFIAGNSRDALGHQEGAKPNRAVGVHRPTFSDVALQRFTVAQFETRHKELLAQLRAFLTERGVPHDITEKLMRHSSQEVYWLTDADLISIGFYSPTYEELIVSKCGRSPDFSRTILNPDGSPGADNSAERMDELAACQSKVVQDLQAAEVPPMLGKLEQGWRPWKTPGRVKTK